MNNIDANLLPVFLTAENNTDIINFSPLPGVILLDRLASVAVVNRGGLFISQRTDAR